MEKPPGHDDRRRDAERMGEPSGLSVIADSKQSDEGAPARSSGSFLGHPPAVRPTHVRIDVARTRAGSMGRATELATGGRRAGALSA
jgi:hypothetical protein